MKYIFIVVMVLVGSNLFAADLVGETTLKKEEIQLSIIESTIYTVGELQPGIHDLLYYSFDPYVESIVAKIYWAYYTDGIVPDEQRIKTLKQKYLSVRNNLVSDLKPIVVGVKNEFVEKKVAESYKNSQILASGCVSDSWSYTLNKDLSPSSRYLVLSVAYQKKGEAFIRVDHIIYREYSNGEGYDSQTSTIETFTSEWVVSLGT